MDGMKAHPPKNCLFCGAEFVPVRSTKKYCSDKCRTLDTLRRQREAEREKNLEKAEAEDVRQTSGKSDVERIAAAEERKRKDKEALASLIAAEADKIRAEAELIRELRLADIENKVPERLRGILSKKREMDGR